MYQAMSNSLSDEAQRKRLRRAILPEAKREVARSDAAQRMCGMLTPKKKLLRCAVLTEAERKNARHVDAQNKCLRRVVLPEAERKVDEILTPKGSV